MQRIKEVYEPNELQNNQKQIERRDLEQLQGRPVRALCDA